jgi:hypothetical protein
MEMMNDTEDERRLERHGMLFRMIVGSTTSKEKLMFLAQVMLAYLSDEQIIAVLKSMEDY